MAAEVEEGQGHQEQPQSASQGDPSRGGSAVTSPEDELTRASGLEGPGVSLATARGESVLPPAGALLLPGTALWLRALSQAAQPC